MANMAQAIRMALHYAEENLNVTDIFGEDVGAPMGGVFTCTQGLKTTWNSPLDERGIINAAIGIAMAGDRCVAEIQFCDYIFNTIDLLKHAGNMHWVSNGNFSLPLVVMTPVGAGIRGSIYHSHSFDAWATRLTGWKIVMPSTPIDAYGLLLSAIKDPNPVLFMMPKALLRVKGELRIPGEPDDDRELKNRIDAPVGDRSQWKPRWPQLTDYSLPIGKARVTREGTAATVVSYGRHLLICNEIADTLKSENIAIEVIDMMSLMPYDWNTIKASIAKTKRVVFINEDTEVTNFAEHLSQRVVTEMFYELLARPRIIAGKNVPGIGLHPNLEDASVPQRHDIKREILELINEVP
ncbi:MAG: transketolase C-terminal domain-containing protein [Pseudomonadota bacterium]|nr:transketolase C-terminal domain-containing protein [Pseudomonadota bacterium]